MTSANRVVLLDDTEADWGNAMRFVLTYEGPLYATQRDPEPGKPPKHGENRKQLRAVFHRQLKELWRIVPHLGKRQGQLIVEYEDDPDKPKTKEIARSIEELSNRHQLYGKRWVPLVTQELELLCSIEILFLRPDRPGSIIWAGDIDNRLKTLLDALRVPEAGEDYVNVADDPDFDPYFVLLEDDKLVTRVAVETDRLLAPVGGDNADVRLIIHVDVKPYTPDLSNSHFA